MQRLISAHSMFKPFGHRSAFPRRRARPSVASARCPSMKRAQGRPGGRMHPGPPAQERVARGALTTGTGGDNRPPLRDGLRLIGALPGEPAFATVISAMRKHHRRLKRLHGRARTTRLRRPRPCRSSFGTAHVHRIPRHVRDDRDTPLMSRRDVDQHTEKQNF